MSDRERKLREAQIDPEHGKEPIADVPLLNTYLSINKAHALQLGIYLGTIAGFLHAQSPIIGAIILTDLALASIGISALTMIAHLYVPNYAFTYTIRKNPWYYLTTLLLSFIITITLL